LALKGIPFESKAVHLVKSGGEQHSESYVAMNPTHKVPTLEIDGLTLYQSTAIAEYIEETHPEPRLLPHDAPSRAHVRALCNVISNDIQPVANVGILQRLVTLLPQDSSADVKAATRDDWSRHFITTGFLALEKMMTPKSGRYCFGDEVSLADVFLAPQVYNALRVGVDMSLFPTINRVMKELELLDAYRSAHPSVQPDAER